VNLPQVRTDPEMNIRVNPHVIPEMAQGSDCRVDADLKALAQQMHEQGKPLGFICIAPALLPKIFEFPLRLTIGTDIDTAEVIEDMGGEHVPCPVEDIVVDEDNKIVTTPAYMLAQNIAEAAAGIDKLVARVLVLTE
jgi:enhancing lycopene biosynthesis protein 2